MDGHNVSPHASSSPGFATPEEAIRLGEREKLMYVICVQPIAEYPDYLATVCVDPESEDFCKVVFRTPTFHCGDELHRMNWNTGSCCYDNLFCKRDRLVLPCLNSSRIYTVDVDMDPLKPVMFSEIDVDKVKALNVSGLYSSNYFASGKILVSTLGDAERNAKGSFVFLDANTMALKGGWGRSTTQFNCDFTHHPQQDIIISTGWGAPKTFKEGLNVEDIENGKYSDTLHVWKISTEEMIQTLKLGSEGIMPLAVRFFHNPTQCEGFVGCALSGTIWRIYKDESENVWKAEKVISIPSKKVNGWIMPELIAFVGDILISMDDRFLYVSCWLHGEVRQYDVTHPDKPVLAGKVCIGGVVYRGGPVQPADNSEVPERTTIQDTTIVGGPLSLQLSLDGKRLYGTTSFYSAWDKQLYPEMSECGSQLFLVDVDTNAGGLRLNQDLLVDFSSEPGGPVLAREMRYPGGDCTSEVWL